MKIKLLLLFLLNFALIQAQAERDSIVYKYIDQINADSIASYIQSLQNFGTRYALADNKDEVVGWIAGKFREFGYDALIDSFETKYITRDTTLLIMKNVTATLPGADPNKNVILCAHHDAVNNNDLNDSPGADDNASGVAAILEIARILKDHNPAMNITFAAVDIEELYCIPSGSEHLAEQAIESGMNINLAINLDMIGYNTQPAGSWFIGICHYNDSEKKYSDFYTLLCNHYTTLRERRNPQGLDPAIGDGAKISHYNIPVITYFEDELNPYYHTSNELLQNLDMEYCTEVIKASCAGLLSFLEMPETKVNDFKVLDGGNGESLVLSWSPDAGFTASGYNIYLGRTDYDYDTIFTTTDTSFVINNLTEDSTYYLRITSFDSRGYEGFVESGTGVPKHLPLSPTGITDEPLMHKVKISWNRNNEYDLAGYNIYRSESTGGEQNLLNPSPILDSLYIDETALDGVYYYYSVKAVDKDNQESILNPELRSRVISLDQGILVVDETTDGNGTIMNPTDEQTDGFYNGLLGEFNNKNYDIISEGGIKLADLGAFSTILWHNTDYSFSGKIAEDMKKYLLYGGKLLITGFYPTKVYSESYSAYPKEFLPGHFVYDYLKISGSDLKFGARFRGGIGTTGYTDIYADSLKTKPEIGYHLTNIESLNAAPGAVEIYTYNTEYDTSAIQGKMKGMPVGVEYLGEDYKVVTLSFPMYYMNNEQSSLLINKILLEKFNEKTGLDETKTTKSIPSEYSLSQNYPNPFNPSTVIKYQIPANGYVTLKVYDILGKEITTLVNEEKSAGRYEVNFNASGLSSGVYIYQVKVNDFVSSRKMILMK